MATILVADDDPALQDFLGVALESVGFTVLVALDGVRACELAEAAPPALILLDLLLPKLDGYGVLLRLRAHEVTRRVPVVVVSGELSTEHAPLARALGAADYLEKPITRERLLDSVRRVIAPAAAG